MTSSPYAVTAPYSTVDWTTHIVVVGSDAQGMQLSRSAATGSGLLGAMLEDSEPGEETIIPVPGMVSAALGLVVEYLEHHSVTPDDPSWDNTFMLERLQAPDGEGLEQPMLAEMDRAANYLDIAGLLRLVASARVNRVAEQI